MQSVNIRPPWGECGTRDLLYYDHYELSTCERECEINATLDTCACLAPFMQVAKDKNGEAQPRATTIGYT